MKGIHSLDISECTQNTITDKAFSNLEWNTYLKYEINADQNTITDGAFVHLKGIHTLNMRFNVIKIQLQIMHLFI